jgi:hypothetical protein
MFVLACSAVVIAGTREKEEAALSAAGKWLTMVDEGKYSESWRAAASYFRSAVKQEQWEEMLKAHRPQLGKVVARNVETKAYKTSLPGAPDGEYVVIQFETSFQNKKRAIETVTSMLDTDGKWRVAGYYIK